MSMVEPDVRSAINAAARALGPQDVVLVLGSFYLAGEVKGMFEAKRAQQGGGG